MKLIETVEVPEEIRTIGKRLLEQSERDVLTRLADEAGAPEIIWRIYDETESTEDNYAEVQYGDPYATRSEAVDEARRLIESGDLEVLSVYRERRCVAKTGKVWYMQDSSPVFDAS